MPHCSVSLKVSDSQNVQSLLSQFTIEYIPCGRAAYPLTNGMYNMDAGQNDIRAIDHGEGIVKFFCRYERDLTLYEKKIRDFARGHSAECTVV
jgi:hypothetical protein